MIEHPNMMRAPDKNDKKAKPTQFTNLERLKVSMLDEMFAKLRHQSAQKRDLIEEVRPLVKPILKERDIPEQAANDVMEKLTNNQLASAKRNPMELLERIHFTLVLSGCTDDPRWQLEALVKEREREAKVRKAHTKFLHYRLR